VTALLLLRRYWQLCLIVVLAGIVMAACHARDTALTEKGRAEERAKALAAQIAVLSEKQAHDSVRADSVMRVVRVDTVTLTRWLTRYASSRDTINVHDTAQVRAFIATADSTVRACTATVAHLLTACDAKDSVISDQRRIIGALKAQPVPQASGAPWRSRVLWAVVGAVAAEGVHRAVHR
jgi:hypothetical protein